MERLPVRLMLRNRSLYSQRFGPNTNSNAPISCPRGAGVSRYFSQRASNDKPKSFFDRLFENIRSEWSQNKEIKENLAKFRQETQKLEETEALKQAREKFKKVESESIKDINEVLQSAKDTLKSGVEKAKEAEFVKKTLEMGDKISSTAKGAAEGISKQGEFIKESAAFKRMSEASRTVEEEVNRVEILSSLYKAPEVLLKRAERSASHIVSERQVQPNEEAQSVELHKDSKWAQSWKKFKDENPYVNSVFELKMKFDESENPLVRATRDVVDKVSDTVGSLFKANDTSAVLTEICKVDPNFDLNNFVRDCEKFIIPTILESMIQKRHDILADWCSEAVFKVLSQGHKDADKLGLKIHSKIIDMHNVDFSMGKMMEQGPVLILTFQTHQVTYVTDSKGNVVEGDPNQATSNTYVMAFCRDQSDLNPYTAWRLIDVAMQQQ